MRKIFSLFAAMMLLVSTASATTVYCKMTQSWWTQDGAAVAVHHWGGETAATNWPGVRMAPVAGEEGMWSYDVPADVTGLMFVRVNGEGDIADWGAKTADLTLPTDGKNLYTITSEEAVWGDPGCNGEWSVYPKEMQVIYDWAGEIGTTVLGPASVEISTVKIHTNTDEVPAIKFSSSYVYADGKWIAIKPAVGGFKAGDVINVALVFNNADDTKYAQIDLRAADGDTRIWLSDAASTINGRTSAADPIVQTYTLEADQDSLFIGRYGNTGMFITQLQVAREAEETPEPAANPIYETYFATGDGWAPDAESSATWNAEAQKVTVTIAADKVAQWQAQVKYQALPSEPNKFYHFGVKMKANNAVSGITVKWDDNTGLVLKEGVALEANTEYVIDMPLVASNAAGNGLIVFDFGFAHAGDVIEIYDVVVEETEAPVVDLEDGYYINGLNGWSIYDLTAADKFEANPEAEGEYMITKTLAAGNEFKVVSVANNELVAWYPAEAGNYVVDNAHAGEKTIYFRPNYDGGEGWHAGCIYVPANEEPASPIKETWFANANWGEEHESTIVWDPETDKITITVAVDKNAQWQGQLKLFTPTAEAGKCYNVAFKLKANNAVTGITFKWQDDNNDPNLIYENQSIALEAGVEYAYSNDVAGIPGNGLAVFDFGFAKAGDIIELYDFAITEIECAVAEPERVIFGVNVPANGKPESIELVGSFIEGGWDNGIILTVSETGWYISYEVYAFATDEFKIRAAGTWDNEIFVRTETGWTATQNFKFGDVWVDDTYKGDPVKWVELDLSGDNYGWKTAVQAIDNVTLTEKAQKVIVDGVLYIVRDGKLFNAQGAIVK